MEIKYEFFANRMRSLLKESGWSQAKFAKKNQLDKTTVNYWCTGKTLPTLPQLNMIIDFALVHAPDKFTPLDFIFENGKEQIENNITKAVEVRTEKLLNEISTLKEKIKQLELAKAHWKDKARRGYDIESKEYNELYNLRTFHKNYLDYKKKFYEKKQKYISEEKQRMEKFFSDKVANHLRIYTKDIIENEDMQKYLRKLRENEELYNGEKYCYTEVRWDLIQDLGYVIVNQMKKHLSELYLNENLKP